MWKMPCVYFAPHRKVMMMVMMMKKKREKLHLTFENFIWTKQATFSLKVKCLMRAAHFVLLVRLAKCWLVGWLVCLFLFFGVSFYCCFPSPLNWFASLKMCDRKTYIHIHFVCVCVHAIEEKRNIGMCNKKKRETTTTKQMRWTK